MIKYSIDLQVREKGVTSAYTATRTEAIKAASVALPLPSDRVILFKDEDDDMLTVAVVSVRIFSTDGNVYIVLHPIFGADTISMDVNGVNLETFHSTFEGLKKAGWDVKKVQ